jgi:nicotinamide mononucleotide adenylyltransferase
MSIDCNAPPSSSVESCDIGVAIGRFQPFHIEHLDYVLDVRSHSRFLVVGVTEPEIDRLHTSHAASHRNEAGSNPFSFFERLTMITAALREAGLRHEDFVVVPAPWAEGRFRFFLPGPSSCMIFVTVLDGWGLERVSLLRSNGYAVTILPRRSSGNPVSGSEIRARLRGGLACNDLLPTAVARCLSEFGFPDREHWLASPTEEVRPEATRAEPAADRTC